MSAAIIGGSVLGTDSSDHCGGLPRGTYSSERRNHEVITDEATFQLRVGISGICEAKEANLDLSAACHEVLGRVVELNGKVPLGLEVRCLSAQLDGSCR